MGRVRGLPGRITRRHLTTGVIVLGTGGVATAAFAGPVVYSEYTTGGDRENRIVREDGSGDVALPKDVMGAAVSPDGRRIAQTTLQTDRGAPEPFRSTLRVSAGDGTGATELLVERPGEDDVPERLISGTPVWSPDGRQVLVLRTGLTGGTPGRRTRVICDVETRACRDAGTVPGRSTADVDWPQHDVAAWAAGAGPIVRSAPRTPSFRARVRCGAGAQTLEGPTVQLQGISGPGFGPPLVLRGLSDGEDATEVQQSSAGVVATADGVLAHDLPGAQVRRGRLSCRGGDAGTVQERQTAGVPRLRLRTGTTTRTLPTPPGLRRGDGLRLVGTDTGGAILIATDSPSSTVRRFCMGRRRAKVLNCGSDDAFSYQQGRARPTTLRVWRYVPGASPRFDRVTTARRSALRTLAAASTFAVATGDAVLVVADGAIERVPLDGGAPTVIARGRGLSLELGTW